MIKQHRYLLHGFSCLISIYISIRYTGNCIDIEDSDYQLQDDKSDEGVKADVEVYSRPSRTETESNTLFTSYEI